MDRMLLTLTFVVGFARLGIAQAPPPPATMPPATMPPAATPADATPPAFRPGLGDLMTTLVQPRHIKLGIAGQEKNWTYAAYELGELQEAFDRVARQRPRYRDFEVAETMQSIMKQPVAALTEAIRNADGPAFAEAYGKLTSACNSCHQRAGREMIVIQVPRTSPYSDEDLQSAKH